MNIVMLYMFYVDCMNFFICALYDARELKSADNVHLTSINYINNALLNNSEQCGTISYSYLEA